MATTTTTGVTYLSGCTNPLLEQAVEDGLNVGLLVQPRSGYAGRVDRFPVWAADNGAFSKVAKFDAAGFRKMLADPRLQAAKGTCQFVVAPDRLVVLADGTVVGDAAGTLEDFAAWATEIRAMGFPVALVAQDGLEDMLHLVDWDLVDVLFLGGSTDWKLSAGAAAVTQEAKARGKRVHMGRVNSAKRLGIAQGFGCDTADGTFLGFGPAKNLPKLMRWPALAAA